MSNKPFLLKPAAKDYIWGGQRLNTEFNKGIDLNPLAETWECSTHPDGPSVVSSGEYVGMPLTDVIKKHPEYLGTRNCGVSDLPILIKLIDANKDLSVQVHPTDEYAKQYENGQPGKSEMWYVLDAAPGAKLVYGFAHDCTKDFIIRALSDGTIMNYLQFIDVKKNDVFFIPSGTVHAIGAGCLIAEIQENSNLTYRLYDYDRVGKDGKKRELHIDKALDVIDTKAALNLMQPMRVLKYKPGVANELLCRCKYFEVNRMLINTSDTASAKYSSDVTSFRTLLCLDGKGQIEFDNSTLEFIKGSCIFIPADSVEIQLSGKAEFLDVKG